jgi:hypothetical protein
MILLHIKAFFNKEKDINGSFNGSTRSRQSWRGISLSTALSHFVVSAAGGVVAPCGLL